MDEAGGLAFRGHPQTGRHEVAFAHQRQGRPAIAVPPYHRHRADHSGGRRHPRTALEVNGVPQRPIEGVSAWPTRGRCEGRRAGETQYFEMFGNRALYHDGWVAGCRTAAAWQTAGIAASTTTPGNSTTSTRLLAVQRPRRQGIQEAARAAGPLHGRSGQIQRVAARRPFLPAGRLSTKPNNMRGRPASSIRRHGPHPETSSSPNTKNVHHTIAAEVEIEDGAEGVLACCGGESRRLYVLHQGWEAALGAQLVQRGPLPRLVERQDPAGTPRVLSAEIRSTRRTRSAAAAMSSSDMGER